MKKGGRTVETAAPALFSFMGSASSSVGPSALRWAFAPPRFGSRCFRIGQRKLIIRTHPLSEKGSDYMGLVPVVGLEPTRGISPADFESATSTNSITPARGCVHPTVSLPRLSPVLNGGREPRRELTNLPESSYRKTAEKSRVEQGLETADVPAFESVTSTNSITPAGTGAIILQISPVRKS